MLLAQRGPAALLAVRGGSATAAGVLRRGLAMMPPEAPVPGGRPTGPSTAAAGSPEGLGRWGGDKVGDYDEKYPTGPGSPAPSSVRVWHRDPEEERRADKSLHLSPHGYVRVQSPAGTPPEEDERA